MDYLQNNPHLRMSLTKMSKEALDAAFGNAYCCIYVYDLPKESEDIETKLKDYLLKFGKDLTSNYALVFVYFASKLSATRAVKEVPRNEFEDVKLQVQFAV